MSVKIKTEPEDRPHPMEVEHGDGATGHHHDELNGDLSSSSPPPIKSEEILNGTKQLQTDPNDPDPVVEEISVFLAKDLAHKLFLFQYPVRPCTMPYNPSSVLSARFKPEQQQVEIEVALDTTSGNFNKSKAEQIAVNVDGKSSKRVAIDDSDKEIRYPSGIMDKQVLVSTKALDNTKRYAVGIVSDQVLHLTPLEGVLTLRNSLDHLDLSDKAKRESSKQADDAIDDEDDPGNDEAASDIKPVTVRFAKSGAESEKYKKAREKSYEFQQQKARQEQWVDLHFVETRSEAWIEESRKLFCKHMADDVQNLDQHPADFLQSIK